MYGTASRNGVGMYGSGARHGLGDAALCDPIGDDETQVFDPSTGCWINADPSVNNGVGFDSTTLIPTVVTTTVAPAPTGPTVMPVSVNTTTVPYQLPTLVVNAPGVLPATAAPSSSLATIAFALFAAWGTYVVVDHMRKGR
jgi:hypothetical protein